MSEGFFKIYPDKFGRNDKGDVLYLDLAAVRREYRYAGLWYACDKNEETYIATEMYYGTQATDSRPPDVTEELSENSFKHSPRYAFPPDAHRVWIAMRTEKHAYCKLKAFTTQTENTYINYKVIRNRGTGYDTLKSGVIKGSKALFFRLGVEDGSGALDYNDTVMFIAFIKDLPPADWNFDPACFGIQKLPVLVPAFLFPVRQNYSNWLGQNPLDGVTR
jgi:hypothetical protein